MWNYMQIQLLRAAGRAEPLIGPGGLTREAAMAAVQELLDRGSALHPQLFSRAAGVWRAGAKDDVVFAGDFVWALYQHPGGEAPEYAAMAWLDDFARIATGHGATWSAARPEGFPAPGQ